MFINIEVNEFKFWNGKLFDIRGIFYDFEGKVIYIKKLIV